MGIETSGGSATGSPFSRPPQLRTSSTPGAAHNAHREPSRPQAPRVAAPPASGEERAALEGQRRSGGQWFYWVAGLSLINSLLALTGQDWRFLLGLGVTQLIEEMAAGTTDGGTAAGVASLVVIALFGVLGYLAIQGHRWPFVVGLVVYALDGVIFLLVQDWIGVGFHAFVLAMILRGYLAARRLA